MDICFLNVEVKRIDLLERMNGLQVKVIRLRDTQVVLGKVNVTDARVCLEPCFILADPKTTLHLKLVVG